MSSSTDGIGLLVLAATRAELGFLAEVEPIPSSTDLRSCWRHGRVLAAETGLGKSNAAATCARLIDRHSPAIVLGTGIAGGLIERRKGMSRLVLADFEIDADLGFRSAAGWSGLEAMGFHSVAPHHNRFPLDQALTDKVESELRAAGHRIHRAGFHTSDTVSGTVRFGTGRCERLATELESMEGAAIVQTCIAMGIPTVELRVVSNPIGRREREAWNLPAAFTALDQALRDLVPVLSAIGSEQS